MKQIPKEIIDEVRARNDIAEVIGSYLPLKTTGRQMKALCPFHKEKTPSFTVNSDRQIYHCFGCGAGGDVIRFVQEYEKTDFMTALRMLADRAGVELIAGEGSGGGNRQELLRIHENIASLYHRILLEHESGAAGRAYLASRALQDQTVKEFEIGFAPDRPDTLSRWAAQKKIPAELLEQAGLTLKSDRGGGYYDRFRNRLMFPIRDEAGRVIGFSGRHVLPEQSGGKYVNSPETPLFHKGRVLFALDKARRAMADSRRAVICEGQLDAIRCHEAGIRNVVATQGTALTPDHAHMIRRYADEIILMFDADAAGRKAALRSSEVFIAEGMSVRIACLPQGEDPDSLIRKEGPEAVQGLLGSASSAVDFLISSFAETENLENESGWLRMVRAIQKLLARAPDAVQRRFLIEQAARKLHVLPSVLEQNIGRQVSRSAPERDAPAAASALANLPPAEAALIQLFFLHYEEVLTVVADHLPPGHFTHPDCRLLYEMLLAGPDDVIGRIPEDRPDAQRLAARLQMEEENRFGRGDSSPEKAAQDIVMDLWRQALTRRRTELQRSGREEDTKEITCQIYLLSQRKDGWERSVGFMVR